MSTSTVLGVLARHRAHGARLPDVLTVVAFGVVTAAALVAVSGALAFAHHDYARAEVAATYTVLALTACGLMTVPIVTLGGIAARLTTTRRNERLAVLRLIGATATQTRVITVAETTLTAVLGVGLGLVGYTALLPVIARIPFVGGSFTMAELWPGPFVLVLVVVAVLVLAVGSALISMITVTVSPLGVAQRVSAGRVKLWRALVAAACLLAWPVAVNTLPMLSLIIVALGVLLAVNLVGPYVMKVLGHLVAAAARRPATLLAARRIIDDPRAAWRTNAVLGLVIALAVLSSMADALAGGPPDPSAPYLNDDLGTGALVTLIIVALVGATSSAVVLATRVIDQRESYRRLGYAGTDLPVLHRARTLEVAIPLLAAAVLGGGFALLIVLPFSAMLGPGVLVRFVLAVAVGIALALGSVLVSRPLVAQAARIG